MPKMHEWEILETKTCRVNNGLYPSSIEEVTVVKRMRVPGGWIYRTPQERGNTSVFIPRSV